MWPQFDTALFIRLSLGCILTVIIGTVSHEAGHAVIAEWFGHDATLHFGSMSFEVSHDPTRHERFWIKLGGPLQTMLTGTLALLIMVIVKRQFVTATALRWWQWVLIMVTFFWLRQPVNMASAIIEWVRTGEPGMRGDEPGLAMMLGLPSWSILLLTGFAGLTVFCITLFQFIPRSQRFTAFCATGAGGCTGFFLWLQWIGRYILP